MSPTKAERRRDIRAVINALPANKAKAPRAAAARVPEIKVADGQCIEADIGLRQEYNLTNTYDVQTPSHQATKTCQIYLIDLQFNVMALKFKVDW